MLADDCVDRPGFVVDYVYDCQWFEDQAPQGCREIGDSKGTDGMTAEEVGNKKITLPTVYGIDSLKLTNNLFYLD